MRILLPVFVILAVTPAAIALILSIANIYERDRTAAIDQATSMVNALAQDNSALLGEAYWLLRTLAAMPAVRFWPQEGNGCGLLLAETLKELPQYSYIGTVSIEGNVQCAGLPVRPGINVADRVWFKRVTARKGLAVGDYAVGRGSNKASVHVAYPIFGLSGEMIGAINAALNVDWLNARLKEVPLEPDANLTLFDSSGTIVARRPSPELYTGSSVENHPVAAAMMAQGSGRMEGRALDGSLRLFAFTQLGGTQWPGLTLSLGRDLAAIEEKARRNAIQVGAMLTGVVFLGLGLALSAAHVLVTSPAGRLTEFATRLASGDLKARPILRTGSSELATLSQALDRMAAALQEREETLAERERARDAALHDMAAAKTSAEKAALAADKAAAAKSRFLAAASHDLRQPVQGLLLFLEGLRLDIDNSSPRFRAMLDGAELSAKALKKILDAMLDLSRLDAGIVRTEPETFALGDFLSQMETEFRHQAELTGLRFRVVPTRLLVRTDPVLLGQIVRNLISNALRYTDNGGIVVGCRRRGRHQLSIQVVDTGIGIPDEAQDIIFDEYVQLGNPERDREKGLGLGLAIVQRLAFLLDARLTVTSRPGRGSTFAIELQVPGLQQQEHRPAIQPANDDGKGLIILIDDEPLVLLGLKTMLESWGYEVLEAVTIDEAVEKVSRIAKCRHSLIIADYRLQAGQTGAEAINRIRDVCGVDAPSIVLTGDTAPERLREALASGYAIMNKPVEPQQLRDAVARALAADSIV